MLTRIIVSLVSVSFFSMSSLAQDYASASPGSSSGSIAEFGLGLSSATSGRHVPTFAGAFVAPHWILSVSSTGARNNYSYFSNYSLAWMRTWHAGPFFWGDLSAGFGVGMFFSQREFQDDGGVPSEKSSDFGLGPSFRVKWSFAGPVYMNMEVIWGIRDIAANLTLNAQDLVTFSVGFEI